MLYPPLAMIYQELHMFQQEMLTPALITQAFLIFNLFHSLMLVLLQTLILALAGDWLAMGALATLIAHRVFIRLFQHQRIEPPLRQQIRYEECLLLPMRRPAIQTLLAITTRHKTVTLHHLVILSTLFFTLQQEYVLALISVAVYSTIIMPQTESQVMLPAGGVIPKDNWE